MNSTNIIGVDPHRRTFTAALLDERGGLVSHEHFDNRKDGYTAVQCWAAEHGGALRWGSVPWGGGVSRVFLGVGQSLFCSWAVTVGSLSRSG